MKTKKEKQEFLKAVLSKDMPTVSKILKQSRGATIWHIDWVGVIIRNRNGVITKNVPLEILKKECHPETDTILIILNPEGEIDFGFKKISITNPESMDEIERQIFLEEKTKKIKFYK